MYRYLVLDSREEPIAQGYSQELSFGSVIQLEVEENIERILDHEYVKLVNMSLDSISIEGRVIERRQNSVLIEILRTTKDELRKNLRIPVNFESFLYPVSGGWYGRETIVSHDISCGGVAFYCSRQLGIGEVAQIVIPVTSQPLLLSLRILRQRPSPKEIPLYAAEFIGLIQEEETMLSEAVFGLQFQYYSNQ